MTEQKKPTDDELLRQITAADATIEVASRNKKNAQAELLARRKDEIASLLKEKDEPYGDVKIIVGNRQLKITTPKKVDWDQAQLETKAKEIAESGSNPKQYLKIEYSVSETAYKDWPQEIRDYFISARTVKPGTVSMKLVEEK